MASLRQSAQRPRHGHRGGQQQQQQPAGHLQQGLQQGGPAAGHCGVCWCWWSAQQDDDPDPGEAVPLPPGNVQQQAGHHQDWLRQLANPSINTYVYLIFV